MQSGWTGMDADGQEWTRVSDLVHLRDLVLCTFQSEIRDPQCPVFIRAVALAQC